MHIREVAMAVGRQPEAARFAERMENHFMYGSHERLPEHIRALGDRA
jgi:betaine-homocysteine S-methyltransferase